MAPDPKPRRHGHFPRKGVEPKGLRRWRLSHRRKADPRPAKHKPAYTGARGGRYWQGPTKRRYDPQRFARLRSYGKRARGYGGKVESGINMYGAILGGVLTLLYGVWHANQHMTSYFTANGFSPDKPDPTGAKTPWERYVNLTIGSTNLDGTETIPEAAHLWQNTDEAHGNWTPQKYLEYKFLGDSTWKMPFWISLIGMLASPIAKIFTSKGQRILKPISKVSMGVFAASTIGALALPGCGETGPGIPQATNADNGRKGTMLPNSISKPMYAAAY